MEAILGVTNKFSSGFPCVRENERKIVVAEPKQELNRGSILVVKSFWGYNGVCVLRMVDLGLRKGYTLARKHGIPILAFINLDPDAIARLHYLRCAGARLLLTSPLSQVMAWSCDLDRAGVRSSLTSFFSRLKAAGVQGAVARHGSQKEPSRTQGKGESSDTTNLHVTKTRCNTPIPTNHAVDTFCRFQVATTDTSYLKPHNRRTPTIMRCIASSLIFQNVNLQSEKQLNNMR
ncbi:hypothetical protein PIB30_078255 [Stylosanthes scabra]|uniref:Uncharacterized protein n=1 Tax=Stylosanthes scabra TaxID=79078 RepID=A0ABU6XP60_9FABA|nr:hypothetical protein [Stylosanthes scabra]